MKIRNGEWITIVLLVLATSLLSADEIDNHAIIQTTQDQIDQEIMTVIAEQIDQKGSFSKIEDAQVTEEKNKKLRSDIQSAIKFSMDKVQQKKENRSRSYNSSNSSTVQNSHTGWIYIGQLLNKQWVEKTLKMGNTLPEVGKNYLINLSVNIRDAFPSKGKMPKVVSILSYNNIVKVLELHRSGNKGHYWAQVQW